MTRGMDETLCDLLDQFDAATTDVQREQIRKKLRAAGYNGVADTHRAELMSDRQHTDHNSWLLNTVDRASQTDGWTPLKRAATAALLGLGAWLAALLALAFTAGPASVPTLLCLSLSLIAVGVDRAVGKRQGGAR